MAAVPECIVCLQLYDDVLHVPRVLACGHSPCEPCVAQLRSSWRSSSSSEAASAPGAGVVRCPECSHRTRLPTGGPRSLPKNVELLRLLPSLLRESGDSAPKSSAENRTEDVGKTATDSTDSLADSLADSLGTVSEESGGAPRENGAGGTAKWKVGSRGKLGNWPLVPCDLFAGSGGAEEGRTWIVPERAIEPRDGASRDELLRGDMELEGGGAAAAEAVTLLRLETAEPASRTSASYEQAVWSAWESLPAEARTEILILGRTAALCRGVCPVVGLWMSGRRRLFLVSRVPGHESCHALEPAGDAARPSEGENCAARASKVGRELCEAVWQVHAQGVVLGLLSPNCVVLDRFGAPLIDVNAVLHERRLLYRTVAEKGAENEGPDSTNSIKRWRYMSPEALSLLTGDNSAAEFQLGRKADVWSLGCLLVESLAGRTPYSEHTLLELSQAVSADEERKILGDFVDVAPHGLKTLLSKCFSVDPDQRPELDELWVELASGPGSANSDLWKGQILGSPPTFPARKIWMVSLPGFVHEGRPVARESQRWRPETIRVGEAAGNGRRKPLPCGLEHESVLEGHGDVVTALVICGDVLLSASFDKTIRVWSLDDDEPLQTLAGHSQVITALAVDSETSRCFSGDTGAKICGWKLGEAESVPLLASWQEHDDWRYTGVTALAVSGDGILYSGSGDRTIKAWSVQNFDLLSTMEGHDALISALLVDGELLYSGSWDGSIRVWWRNDHSRVAVLGNTQPAMSAMGGVRVLCLSDNFLFAGCENGTVQVWKDEECLTTVKAHDKIVSTLCVEGNFLYTGSWDCHIKAWRVDEILYDPEPTLTKNCHVEVYSLVSDGDKLYVGAAEKAIKIYSLMDDSLAASAVETTNPQEEAS